MSHPRRAGLPGTLCFRERPRRTGQENQVSGAETSSSRLGPHLLKGGRPDPTDVVTDDAVGPWRRASRIQRSLDEKPPTPTQPSHELGIKHHQTRINSSISFQHVDVGSYIIKVNLPSSLIISLGYFPRLETIKSYALFSRLFGADLMVFIGQL